MRGEARPRARPRAYALDDADKAKAQLERLARSLDEQHPSVTRWQSGTMALCWALAGTMEAEKTWRRLMGKADKPKLVTALRRLDLVRVAPMTTKRAA